MAYSRVRVGGWHNLPLQDTPIDANALQAFDDGLVAHDAAITALQALPPGSASDASSTVKGVVRLAGDLGGTSTAPTVPGLAAKANAPTASAATLGDVVGNDSAQSNGVRWFTAQEHVARALGWTIVTDSRYAGGADPTGAASSSAAVNAAIAALPSSGAHLYFPPGVFILNTATSGVLMRLSGLTGLTVAGAGKSATILRIQSVTTTDGIRIDGCPDFTMHHLTVQVTNGAKITNAVQYTCPVASSMHNGTFSDVLVVNPSQVARSIFDACTVSGSAVVTSSAAAFTSTDVGGVVGITQLSDVLIGTVQSVATRTGTVSNSGTALTATQTTIPLTAVISGAPSGNFTVMIGSERLFVYSGGAGTALSVVRGYDGTTAATHPDGSTVTTSQATLDVSATLTSTNPLPAKIQTVASSVMRNAISVGTDHAVANLDIAQLKFVGVEVEGAIGAGWRLGAGVSGNILDLSHTACEAALCTVGVLMNGAVTKWEGPSIGENGVDFKVGVQSSQPIVVSGVRSEDSGVFWEWAGAQTSVGTAVSIRDCHADPFHAPDGIPIRHLSSAPLNLDQLLVTLSTPGQTIAIQAYGNASSPLYYQARGVVSNGGNPSPHPSAGATVVRHIFPGPLATGTGSVGQPAGYGTIIDDYTPAATSSSSGYSSGVWS